MSIIRRNFAPMLVETFAEKGGLNQVIFLPLFRFLASFPTPGSNWRLKLYPHSLRAFWYGGIASLKISSFAEMLFSLLFTAAGRFLVMEGGWLLFLLTYWMVLLGFIYGLKSPESRSRVTSRKFTLL